MNPYIKNFGEVNISDISTVGGKNASLGEMISRLSSKGIPVPEGFATTVAAFQRFMSHNALYAPLEATLKHLDTLNFSNLKDVGSRIRELFLHAVFPVDLEQSICDSYYQLGKNKEIEVAVRSSATTEDLPLASFAGQHESYLNIKGNKALLQAVKNCFASLYTDRAIKYREDNGFSHAKVLLSVGIQKMVRSDKACSGICFTLEPESGFRDIVHISGTWGLGENIVQGNVTPDEFYVFKPTLLQHKNAIVYKRLGAKEKTMVYGDNENQSIINTDTIPEKKACFVLHDSEVTKIANWALQIEAHYQKPMDIEWAKDGLTGDIYIIQARPETVHANKNPLLVKQYQLNTSETPISQGQAVGTKIATGRARILQSSADDGKLKSGEIVITDLTSPDWDPVLKKAAGIVTKRGGRTSHASIVARELGVPAIVGCGESIADIQDGELITLSCSEGKTGLVYRGSLPFTEAEIDFSKINKPATTEVMLITSDPEKAFGLSFYPNDGVGLMRIEFIITHNIKIHPMALVRFNEISDDKVKQQIEELTLHYADKREYFIEKLAQGIAVTAAAFYPKDVIVRMSDFKTNEYANLIGGKAFEPVEENPMLGFRGASRYYNDLYREGFSMECEAVRRVRDEMGLTNIKIMIPFCRTPEEGNKVIAAMKKYGLEQGVNELEVYVMAEIPSNVMLADKFAAIFDGFSIGSNDLTQLVLGVDRDSSIINNLFSEQNQAVKEMIAGVIHSAKKSGVKIGLCGQAPSDFPEFAQFLVEEGIDSISFNPDALLAGIANINKAELKLTTSVSH